MALPGLFSYLFCYKMATRLNLFTPKFLKWTLSALDLDMSAVANKSASQK